MTPLRELKDYHRYDNTYKEKEESSILWWVFMVISCILSLVYMIVLYLEYIDNPKSFDNKFNNEERLRHHGLSNRDLHQSEMLAENIKDQFA